jgi:DNA-binding PadR family transcriptional regulator
MKHEDLTPFLPLSPAVLHICLALVREDRHGYGIMQEVARESGGGCRLGPGTLYDNLQRLITQSLIEEAQAKSPDEDPRRRYYRLTDLGKRVLNAEIDRLEKALLSAKMHLRGSRARRNSA